MYMSANGYSLKGRRSSEESNQIARDLNRKSSLTPNDTQPAVQPEFIFSKNVTTRKKVILLIALLCYINSKCHIIWAAGFLNLGIG